MLRSKFSMVISAILITTILAAQTFSVKYQYDTIGRDETFQIEFTIKNLDGKFTAPSFDGFLVASGPNSSSRFSMINGEVDQMKTYSYILIPNQSGEIMIDQAELATADKIYKTEPIPIYIMERNEPFTKTKKDLPRIAPDQKPTKKRTLKRI